MNDQLYKEALGLNPHDPCDKKEVKKAWKEKCKEHHPDKGGEHEKFLQVTHAYKMLTDPSYKREESINEQSKRADLSIRIQVPISFYDGFFGKEFTITYNRNTLKEDGSLVIQEEQFVETATNRVQPGTGSPTEFILQGKGLFKEDSEETGDAFIIAMPQPHPRFCISGMDVVSEELVPLDILLTGGEIEVDTMYGLKTVRIKPGTQPGEKLKISRSGVRKIGAHVFIIKTKHPSKDELKKKKSWLNFKIKWSKEEEEEDNSDEEMEARFGTLRAGNTTYKIFTGSSSSEGVRWR